MTFYGFIMFSISNFTRRDLVYIAIFGSVWGLAEATLGAILHLLHIPLSGAILASIGMALVLIARYLNPKKGSTVLMAFIAATIKLLSFSTVKMGPFLAILMEGLTLEIILSLFGPTKIAFTISAFITAIYPILQSIAIKSIMFGGSFVPILLELIEGLSQSIGYQAGWWVLGLYIFLHFLSAFSALALTWILLRRIKIGALVKKKRLTTEYTEPQS